MQLKSILIYLGCIATPILLGLIISLIVSGNAGTYFTVFSLATAIICLIVVYSVAQKFNITIDINNYNIEDPKSLLLNDLFVGLLIAVPSTLFISILL